MKTIQTIVGRNGKAKASLPLAAPDKTVEKFWEQKVPAIVKPGDLLVECRGSVSKVDIQRNSSAIGFFDQHGTLIAFADYTAKYRREMVYRALRKDGDQQWLETLRTLAAKEMHLEEKFRISFEHFEFLVVDRLFPKWFVTNTRQQYRLERGLKTDCRRYVGGQPARDMRRAA